MAATVLDMSRSQRAATAILRVRRRWGILVRLLLATSLVAASSCATRTPQPSGSGWPNLALSQQVETLGGTAVAVKPLAIGAAGAVFEVAIDVEAAPGEAVLAIQDSVWPWPQWELQQGRIDQSAFAPAGSVYLLQFDSGGAPIGTVILSIEWRGALYEFTWRI